VQHLWNVLADASASGNCLHEPLRSPQGTPVRHVLDRAERTASDVLAALGFRPQRLGILMDNGEPWLRAALAAARLNAAFVPLPRAVGFAGPSAYAEYLLRVTADAGLDGVLSTKIAAALAPVPLVDVTEPVSTTAPPGSPDQGDDALAVIQYTSGSTARPKGVTLTHRNVIAGLEAVTGALGWTGDDVFGIWIPLFHDMGLFATLSGLARGSSACLWRPSDFVRRPMDWLASFARSPATVLPAPNFCFDYLVTAAGEAGPPAGLDLSRWRIACNGAEQVQRRSLERFGEVFGRCGLGETTLAPVYGLAEATLVVTAPEPGQRWHGVSLNRDRLGLGDAIAPAPARTPGARDVISCGVAAPGISLRVAAADGTTYADGTVGEVQITGPAVTRGYLGLPSDLQPFTDDGWLRTGDLAFRLGGELYIVGRLKDMITVRGQNFYAEDVEEVVRSTPGINLARNAAVAWTDGADERMVVLWETALKPAAATALAVAAHDRVKRLLGLAAVDVIPVPPATIPHTTSGKVRRQAVGQLVRDREFGLANDAGARAAAQRFAEGETR
jgi:fatty-acyl-CoA synthase